MEYAPFVFKALNGVFCIYKPPGRAVEQVVQTLKTNLTRELNKLQVRPARERVVISNGSDENLPIVTTVPDLSDHPLVVGPRYIEEDFRFSAADALGWQASGVLVIGIGNGVSVIRPMANAQYMRVYHVKGQLGMATQDFTPQGRVIQRTTFHHINRPRIDRVLAGIQLATRNICTSQASGIDLQSQEAYDLACQGLIRPKDRAAGPVVYGIRCIDYVPPDFTIEVHAINETTSYLMKLIHEIGLELRSTAVCTQVRRIRYGRFSLVHALLMKHCNARALVENIQFCRPLLADGRLDHNQTIVSLLDDPVKDQTLIESGKYVGDLDS